MLISLLTLSACAKDTTAPVINSVNIVSKTVTVEATDNKKVTGYKSTINNLVPAVDSDNWQTSNVFTFSDDGTYYVWVKDAAGNITGYSEAIVVNTLAERFDHLNWLTPATGTKTVDGVTYNLEDLKTKYGDLYRYVEPLTNAEIESRFAYIAKFYEIQSKKMDENGGNYDWNVETGIRDNDVVWPYWTTKKQEAYRIMYKSNDPLLIKFNQYFNYSTTIKDYGISLPESFSSMLGLRGIGTDIINKVTMFEKDFYVRTFVTANEQIVSVYEELKMEPDYVYKDWDSFTK
jgi:hypothetical protein